MIEHSRKWISIGTIRSNGSNRYKAARVYLKGQKERATDLYKRLRSNRYSMVLIGRRLFTVEEPRRTRLPFYYAHVKPFPRHRGTQT